MTVTLERRKTFSLRLPSVENDLTRREFIIGSGAAFLLGAAGCASDTGSGEETTSGNTRVVEHKYGSTEIGGTPQRIVTVGLTDHDAVLALGVRPVGVMDWYGDFPGAAWPWARDEYGGELPEIVSDTTGPNFEAIAAQNPDLILGLYSGVTEQQYETLSEIAPTIAQPADFVDYGVPWQEQTRITGRALDRVDRAEELISSVEERFDEVREQYPEFEGATVLTAGFNGPGAYFVYGPEDAKARFMNDLGFEYPEAMAEVVGDEFGTEISAERFDLLDQDVLIWSTSTTPELITELEESEVYQRLDVAREGRDVFLTAEDTTLNGALSFSTVLSLPVALDGLVPRLAAALDDDPDTEVEEVTADTQ